MKIKSASRIAGIGAYLPPLRVTTRSMMEEINSTRFEFDNDYIEKIVGVKEVRNAAYNVRPSDVATTAAEIAMKDAGIDGSDIDLILYTGITEDYIEPSTAHQVQDNLSAYNAFCSDVKNACLGFMDGLATADTFISSNVVETALVCTGEVPSPDMHEIMDDLKRTEDPREFKLKLGAVTVGDAGGAAIVQKARSEKEGWKWAEFSSNGRLANLCHYRRDRYGIKGRMVMNKISAAFLSTHSKAIKRTMDHLDWEYSDINTLFCHQIGAKPHQRMIEIAHQTVDSTPITYDLYGNLTSATIPVLMHLNKPARGDKILFMGAGSGLSICQGGMIY